VLIVDEHNLRKRIAELQEFRRMGITTAAEAEAFEQARAARVSRTFRGTPRKLIRRLDIGPWSHASDPRLSLRVRESTLASIVSCTGPQRLRRPRGKAESRPLVSYHMAGEGLVSWQVPSDDLR
jgi:hypothetical protein